MSFARRVYEESPATIRSVAAAVAARLPPNLRFGSAFAHQSRLLHESREWSSRDLEHYVLGKLAVVLGTANSRVPHYQSFLAGDAQKTWNTDGTLGWLAGFPVLTKSEARYLGPLLSPTGISDRQSRMTTTSGTSGSPLSLRVSYAASAREWAFMIWHWEMAGMRSGGRRAVLRGQYVPSRRYAQYWYDEPLTRARVFSSADLSSVSVKAYARALRDYGPSVLHAYPSTALLLSRLMRSVDEKPPSLDLVLLGSEGISRGEREELESFFGCPCFEWYGHTEKCVLAYEAEEPGLFAPEWLYGVVELVDDAGGSILEEGVPGRIVGTGFVNDATILIRYATDDWASWAVAPKPGALRESRLTGLIPHRGRDVLIASDGSEISMTYLHGAHVPVLEKVLEMQFVQIAPGEVRLDVVMAAPARLEDYEALESAYRKRLQGRVSLTVSSVERTLKSPGGKRLLVRDAEIGRVARNC